MYLAGVAFCRAMLWAQRQGGAAITVARQGDREGRIQNLLVVSSTSASARLAAARQFLSSRHPASELVIVGASRGAADDFARTLAREAGATFGLTRFSLTELAARAAAAAAVTRRAPGADAGLEAMAARATFDALAAGELAYFRPVADLPGFPRAIARTGQELRLAGVGFSDVVQQPVIGRDLGGLLSRVEDQLRTAGVDDRAALFRLAAEACRADRVRWARLPV